MDVAVLGAGPGGLMAAWRAARAGHRVAVVERAPAPGGMAASFEVGGVRVDHGSHRLHPSTDPAVLADLRRLLGDDLQWRRRNGRLRLDGRWVAFPFRPLDLARRLPRGFAARVARDAVTARWRTAAADTFADEIRAGLGPTVLERFYGPYARKLWGLDADAISGEQARRRVNVRSPVTMAGRVARSGGTGFWYPASGFGAIVEALAGAATGAGVDLRCGDGVAALRRGGRAWEVELASGGSVHARLVLSTLPVTALARLLRPAPPAEVGAAAGSLAFRAMLLVYLVLGRRRWTPFDAHYLPGPETPVSRVSEPKNYRSASGDPPARTVLCAEVPCAPGDAQWSLPDGELATRVAVTLEACGLPAVRPREVVVRRLPAVYPVYRLGWERPFAALDAWTDSLPGLVTFGRGGLFSHDNSHHAMAMGRAAADAIRADGSWDDGAWAAARARARGHVVED